MSESPESRRNALKTRISSPIARSLLGSTCSVGPGFKASSDQIRGVTGSYVKNLVLTVFYKGHCPYEWIVNNPRPTESGAGSGASAEVHFSTL